MEVPFTNYYLNLRTALADPGVAGAYGWADEQLRGGLLTVIQTGIGPLGMTVSEDNEKTVTDAAAESYDARGYLVFQAALLLIGGQVLFSHKQRALSVTYRPEERAMTIDHLRRMVGRLEKQGDPHGTGAGKCFGIWQDYENALCPRTCPEQIA